MTDLPIRDKTCFLYTLYVHGQAHAGDARLRPTPMPEQAMQ